jgi:hypothetical protein
MEMPISLAALFWYTPSEAIVRTVGKALAGTVAACKIICLLLRLRSTLGMHIVASAARFMLRF